MSKSPTSQHLKTLAGSTAVVIKGESQQEYDQGREATIRDIGAQSPLEVYLAEKMFDCLWWIRRLDAVRVDVIREGMVQALDYFQRNAEIRELIAREEWDDPAMQRALQKSDLTVDTLPAAGMIKAEKSLESMDKQTGFRMKMFRDLQKAYEAHTNRQLNTDRLTLQNRLLSQHISVNEIKADD